MWLSPVWNIKCFRGCLRLCELILFERAFRYSILERIQLGREMKLILRPAIKSHPTLSFEKQGTSKWMRDWALLCKVFVIRPCRTIYSSMGCFLKYTPTEHWKQFRLTALIALTIKNWHSSEKRVISTAGTGQKCVIPPAEVFVGRPNLSHFVLAFLLLLRKSGGSFYTFIMKFSVHVHSRVNVFIVQKRSVVFI